MARFYDVPWHADATEHIAGQASKLLIRELVERACTVDDTRDKIALSCDANAIIMFASIGNQNHCSLPLGVRGKASEWKHSARG